MTKATFKKLTKFAQDIVDSTPKEHLEDEWFEFDTGNEILDINIWMETRLVEPDETNAGSARTQDGITGGYYEPWWDSPIRATAFTTRLIPGGYRETVTDQIYCNIPIDEA